MAEVQYVDDGRTAVFNGRTYRRDKHTGYYLASKGDDGRRKRLHIAVWEHHNGPVPEGHHIHHADRDKGNNEIGNLQCLTADEHRRFHARNMTDEQKERLRRHLAENVRPKAAEWHASDEGRRWHSEHAMEAYEGREAIWYECTNCGSEFSSRHRYAEGSNRFCSNACKSAYRRKSGADDITIVCDVCGHQYRTNRYQIRACPECKRR